MEAKSDKCLFVGKFEYKFYKTLEQKLFVLKYIVFLGKEFILREDSGSKGELGDVQNAQINRLNLRLLLMLMKQQLILMKHKHIVAQVGYVLLK